MKDESSIEIDRGVNIFSDTSIHEVSKKQQVT